MASVAMDLQRLWLCQRCYTETWFDVSADEALELGKTAVRHCATCQGERPHALVAVRRDGRVEPVHPDIAYATEEAA